MGVVLWENICPIPLPHLLSVFRTWGQQTQWALLFKTFCQFETFINSEQTP